MDFFSNVSFSPGEMVSSGQPNSIGGSHSASHALIRVNSGLLGSQGASMPPQGTFSSLVSPRSQYNVNLLESSANVSSLLNHNFENESSATCFSGLSRFQTGSVDTMAESNPMSVVANDVGFTSSLKHANSVNSTSSGQAFNNQIQHPSGSSSLSDQQKSQLLQFEPQESQHGQELTQHLSVSQNHMQQQQPHFQSLRGGLGTLAPVKLESQGMNDNIGLPQKLPALQSLAPVKLEPQQNQINRSLGPVKLENQVSDQAAILQNQRQQLLHMSRQSSQAAVAQMNYIQQQRILQQQQQQLLRALPQQQSQLYQQFQQQNLPIRSPVRQVYEPGTCARRLTQYMYQQQHRPNDNNIEFWRKFVAEFFASSARKRWCVSLYGNTRQTIGVFPQDLWQCEICNRKPGRGFETTFEVLPRLFKIKYDSGTLEELLYVDMPREYPNANGQIVLDYAKAIQESVFEHLRVVRDGQLRIVFSPDLKICSWEFCAKHHEELIPRRLIIPQVSQLGAAAQKYQASAQSSSANSQKTDLESNCNMFLASARQLAKALEVPLVNELGYSKRYIRCLQISEVVNSMKDLIDFSRQTGKGPMESLAQFPSKKRSLLEMNDQVEQPERLQFYVQAKNNDHNSTQVGAVSPSTSNAVPSMNNSNGTIPIAIATSHGTGAGLIHQSSMNSQIDNQMNNHSGPYTGIPVQMPSAGSSSNLPPSQPSASSPFSSPTPSSSNNLNQGSYSAAATINNVSSTNSSVQMSMRNPSESNELGPNESQSSVEKIIHELMTTSQFTGADSVVGVDSRMSNIKSINSVQQSSRNVLANGNSLVSNGNVIDNSGKVGGRNCLTDNAAGVMAAMENNLESLTGRIGRSMMHPGAGMSHQQQEMSNRLLNGLGANNFYDQFTWRSP